MKVYVVLKDITYGNKIVGVFNNEDDACQFAKESSTTIDGLDYSVEEHEVIE